MSNRSTTEPRAPGRRQVVDVDDYLPLIKGSRADEVALSIERAVSAGTIPRGATLPSIRQLAERLNVSATTVSAGYRLLRNRGIVTTEQRSRTRVSGRPPIATRQSIALPDHIVDLASGNPCTDLLPSLEEARQAVTFKTRLYGEEVVLPELRELAAESFRRDGVSPERLTVVHGGLDGVERVLAAHLKPGDRVIVEDPVFTGVIDLVRALGLVPRPVEIDGFGLVPDALARTLQQGAEACIFTTRAQNPTGAAPDAQRARELRDVLATDPRLLVVEDDHVAPVAGVERHDIVGERDRWVVVRSVAKSYGPDLRLALMAGDALTIGRVEGRLGLGSAWVSTILQRLVAWMLQDEGCQRRIQLASETYARRRVALVQALAAHGVDAWGRSGFNVWVPLEETETVLRGLLALGWAVRGGERYRLESGPGIRITTAALSEQQATAVAADLARLTSAGDRSTLR